MDHSHRTFTYILMENFVCHRFPPVPLFVQCQSNHSTFQIMITIQWFIGIDRLTLNHSPCVFFRDVHRSNLFVHNIVDSFFLFFIKTTHTYTHIHMHNIKIKIKSIQNRKRKCSYWIVHRYKQIELVSQCKCCGEVHIWTVSHWQSKLYHIDHHWFGCTRLRWSDTNWSAKCQTVRMK